MYRQAREVCELPQCAADFVASLSGPPDRDLSWLKKGLSSRGSFGAFDQALIS